MTFSPSSVLRIHSSVLTVFDTLTDGSKDCEFLWLSNYAHLSRKNTNEKKPNSKACKIPIQIFFANALQKVWIFCALTPNLRASLAFRRDTKNSSNKGITHSKRLALRVRMRANAWHGLIVFAQRKMIKRRESWMEEARKAKRLQKQRRQKGIVCQSKAKSECRDSKRVKCRHRVLGLPGSSLSLC